jgi:hypothetical protein
MENKIYQDEFEQFLQDEVKQHRMYPSDHIWKNIRTDLHGYRAWPALTFISLFIITALTISTLLSNPPRQQPVIKSQPVVVAEEPATVASPIAVITHRHTNYFEKIAAEQITAETFAITGNAMIETDEPLAVNALREVSLQPVLQPSVEQHKLSVRSLPAAPAEQPISNVVVATDRIFAPEQTTSIETPAKESIAVEEKTVETIPSPAEQKKADTHATADEFLKEFGYVANVTPRRNPRFGFQFYITPSTSYRKLSDEKVKEVIQPAVAAAASSQNAPLTTVGSDVNSVVRHKPAIGFEVGFAVLYNMSPRFKFKTGLQLNVRQYYIETFQSLTNDLASLSLINYRGVETISFYSQYNNNTGYRQTQLENQVYQVSVPVGLQWEALQGKHFGINTEASIQPTMTLNNNTYLLSTDYKHYTNGKDFIRKWNINTSVGFNITYKVGSTAWQVGPQIRYQHLPTYSNAYPVKEYLMDYGVRLGFTKQIR